MTPFDFVKNVERRFGGAMKTHTEPEVPGKLHSIYIDTGARHADGTVIEVLVSCDTIEDENGVRPPRAARIYCYPVYLLVQLSSVGCADQVERLVRDFIERIQAAHLAKALE